MASGIFYGNSYIVGTNGGGVAWARRVLAKQLVKLPVMGIRSCLEALILIDLL